MRFLKSFFKILGVATLPILLLSSCNKKADTPAEPNKPQDLATRGKQIYQSTCIACHNSDPKKSGSLGPEVYGSSLELITARVMRAEYPAGYKPKRSTKVMAALPQFKNDLSALAAYLNSPSVNN